MNFIFERSRTHPLLSCQLMISDTFVHSSARLVLCYFIGRTASTSTTAMTKVMPHFLGYSNPSSPFASRSEMCDFYWSIFLVIFSAKFNGIALEI